MYVQKLSCKHVQHFAIGPDYMNSVCINKYNRKYLIFPLSSAVDIGVSNMKSTIFTSLQVIPIDGFDGETGRFAKFQVKTFRSI